MTILIFLIVSYILLSISLYLIFKKTDVNPTKGLIPGINFVEWGKLVGRKPAYALWLLFPIVNIFIFCGLAVDLVRSFGKYGFKHSAAAVLYAPAAFAKIATDDKSKYLGPTLMAEKAYMAQIEEAREKGQSRQLKKLTANNPYHKSQAREWTEAIFFAVFAAAFIRMFLIEAYKIPTPSMENSLNVGDFLFVSKAHYGIRTPMTPLMIPLLHNRIPFIGGESYLEKPSLPYYRLPALESIDRNEPIVFNWPVGDSVYLAPGRSFTVGQYNRSAGVQGAFRGTKPQLITRPIDKKDHYIKRCIALPGDSMQIIDRQVYVNGEKAENSPGLQFAYAIQSTSRVNREKLDELGVTIDDHPDPRNPNSYFLTQKQVDAIKGWSSDIKVVLLEYDTSHMGIYPHDPGNFAWTTDNFGPIYIPKKGETIQLTPNNITLYERVMNVYDHNESYKRTGNEVTINGEKVTEYTFKQDYYWGMGDNRHNSEDCRAWGFIPEDHIVGKPLFIWFSTKNGDMTQGINWSRIFTGATKMD